MFQSRSCLGLKAKHPDLSLSLSRYFLHLIFQYKITVIGFWQICAYLVQLYAWYIYCSWFHNISRVIFFLAVKMLSGIATYLFGSTADDDLPGESDDVKLTTFPMENEWLLVDRAGMSTLVLSVLKFINLMFMTCALWHLLLTFTLVFWDLDALEHCVNLLIEVWTCCLLYNSSHRAKFWVYAQAVIIYNIIPILVVFARHFTPSMQKAAMTIVVWIVNC